ncbi:uncharacterized protein GGS22DRAFT_150428 [Annulohypoxylon maeteangense]|uniref:uncharacterized protein n=1 Tax=Annulohypoxylon maeteangense TaxID=1927788 RepID=UPI002007A201|nr:uncharacterized protein GGS22DRAFT_150428 [Annulohypoxylon maeteangense]KAI0890259.1 hypothetical protein GGS22DRAFT_150428 [Annulohypoxylon maeteangense]
MSSASFLILSPALPSELLTYILNCHVYPTTLIICSSRQEFLASLADDVYQGPEEPVPVEQGAETPLPGVTPTVRSVDEEQARQKQRLLSSPLYQVATSRHIRVIYIPTVTHLRAYLSVFSPDDSKIPVPPANFNSTGRHPPHIILYGFLEMHRDTSEWSAQGLGNSASTLVELGHRLDWETVIIEPRKHNSVQPFQDMLKEVVPFLSGGGRRLGPDSEEGGWTGRTVEVGRVMKRWFHFQRGEWDTGGSEDKEHPDADIKG